MNAIGRLSNEVFDNWDLRLSADAIESRSAGRIVKSGWTIWYAFGSEEGREYLDYYASHRMTNDQHVRLYVDDRLEILEAMIGGYVLPKDPDAASKARAEFLAYNRSVRRMLDEKGFTLEGSVHPSVVINHYQLTGGADGD